MTWWVLTFHQEIAAQTSLEVLAFTNSPDLLNLTWSYSEPTKEPILRTWRGVLKFCGYTYHWIDYETIEQEEPGDTVSHSWILSPLMPGSTIWYYLWAPGGPYGLQIQSPLFHVTLPTKMPLAVHVFNSTDIEIPPGDYLPLPFDSELYDTDNMHDIVIPTWTRLSCKTPGYYDIFGQVEWEEYEGARLELAIRLNGDRLIASIILQSNPEICTDFYIHAQWELEWGDYLELCARHNLAETILIFFCDAFSPHFMMIGQPK